MYNINLKRIFVITEIVHINAGVSSEKEKVKESQTITKRDTPARHPHRVPGRGRHNLVVSEQRFRGFWNFLNIDRV